jgi:hypothetical protein
MSLITDELVWVVRTSTPCCCSASVSRAENVLSSYCFCHAATWVLLRVFVAIVCSGRLGRPVRDWGRTVTVEVSQHESLCSQCAVRSRMTPSESQRVRMSQYCTRSHATVTRQVTSPYRKETVQMTSHFCDKQGCHGT